MGESGSGKTTLLRILAGLEVPDSGELRGTQGLRTSFAFQEDRLLEQLDAPGNVRFVCPAMSREEIIRQFEYLGIARQDCVRPVREYSGGMKRRVAFLRAVDHPSELLLLDEPFKGLDEHTAELAVRFLLENRRGRTVIMATHSMEEARRSGAQVVRIGGGEPGAGADIEAGSGAQVVRDGGRRMEE